MPERETRRASGALLFAFCCGVFGGLIGYSLGLKEGREHRVRGHRQADLCRQESKPKKRQAKGATTHKGGSSRAEVRRARPKPPSRGRKAPLGVFRAPRLVLHKARGYVVSKANLRHQVPIKQARGGASFKYMEEEQATTLHPWFATLQAERRLVSMLFEPLVGWAQDGGAAPALALSWEASADHQALTVRLRQGVRWHDGHLFGAQDVAATVDGLTKHAYNFATRRLVMQLERLELLSPSKVRFVFRRPLREAWRLLRFAILPAHQLQGPNQRTARAFGKRPCGTGPFLLHSWRRPSILRLRRFTLHWRPLRSLLAGKHIKRVTMQVVDEREVQAMVMHYGGTHGMLDLHPTEASSLRRIANIRLLPQHAHHTWLMLLNHTGLLREKALRKALAYAIPYQKLRKQYLPHAKRISGPVFPFARRLQTQYTYTQDLDKARQILDRAGWKMTATGFRDRDLTLLSLRMLISAREKPHKALYEAVRAAWQQLGVRVSLHVLEHDAWKKTVFVEKDFDIVPLRWHTHSTKHLAATFHSQGTKNITGAQNKEVDQALARLHLAHTHATRFAAAQTLHKALHLELPALWLWATPRQIALQKAKQWPHTPLPPTAHFSHLDRWTQR